jgi:hypothetical protein
MKLEWFEHSKDEQYLYAGEQLKYLGSIMKDEKGRFAVRGTFGRAIAVASSVREARKLLTEDASRRDFLPDNMDAG